MCQNEFISVYVYVKMLSCVSFTRTEIYLHMYAMFRMLNSVYSWFQLTQITELQVTCVVLIVPQECM